MSNIIHVTKHWQEYISSSNEFICKIFLHFKFEKLRSLPASVTTIRHVLSSIFNKLHFSFQMFAYCCYAMHFDKKTTLLAHCKKKNNGSM